LDKAESYCTRLLDFGGPAKEAAKALLREIRAAVAAHGMGGVPSPMSMSH
jgi:hypothetical protein